MVKSNPVEAKQSNYPKKPIHKNKPSIPQGPPTRVIPFCNYSHSVG